MTELLTLPETAEATRTPEATLRYWRHKGTGPRSFRVGRRVMYKRDDVEAWIAAQYAQQPVWHLERQAAELAAGGR